MANKIKTAGKGGFSDLSAATRRAIFSVCVLVALFALFAIMSPDKFLAATNLQNLLQQVVTYTIIGCGLSFCLVCGGNDLSAGASMALSGIIVVNLLIMGPAAVAVHHPVPGHGHPDRRYERLLY